MNDDGQASRQAGRQTRRAKGCTRRAGLCQGGCRTPPMAAQAGVMASASGNATCKVEPGKGNHDILTGPSSNIARLSHSAPLPAETGLIVYGRIAGGHTLVSHTTCLQRTICLAHNGEGKLQRGRIGKIDWIACAISDANLYRPDRIPTLGTGLRVLHGI